ncbi:MAG: prepilin-type N-terminal cleavage/methylation domain-containing protein [Gammaproteobacteria bacterium]|nr:prepilin-type N-terminal cleavage/methylation domain-containing protein [Gammaproteobacteria bacterium]
MKRRQSGLNLVELMVALVVAGIALSIGVPSFNVSIKNSRLTTAVNNLVTSMHIARSEATKRGTPVTLCRTDQTAIATPVCGSGSNWRDGWMVFVDTNNNATLDSAAGEDVLHVTGAQHEKLNVISDNVINQAITYRANGFANLAPGGSGPRYLVFCDDSKADRFSRVLAISNTGRPQIIPPLSPLHTRPSCE